jgi:hypothetical protein
VFTKERHRSLSRARWIQSTPSNRISLRSILILSSHLRLDQVRGSVWHFVTCWFYDGESSARSPTPKLEDHPLSAARDCLSNTFAATLHTWRPSPSATWGRAMPWWQGTHLTSDSRLHCATLQDPVVAGSDRQKPGDGEPSLTHLVILTSVTNHKRYANWYRIAHIDVLFCRHEWFHNNPTEQKTRDEHKMFTICIPVIAVVRSNHTHSHYMIHFNNIISCTPRCLAFTFYDHNIVYISQLSCACYVPRPSHPPNNLW